ncbi:YdcF family protein [Alkalicoccobacillus murimartini]|uniref:Uncharacterized SAM-binding protein YcdF (DUF218 family) n=1 Tax=Alkalicoccobacillus murimartini TaxID=171685 RepID=A0ABT9YDU8_9BACI|nr:YdcF family protein [Alkalicoccobacillus murimartini]MDQ0205711.1 uncharacterized SAM-binding protein YcdF (DUF218 family) [Alkalicoccobacillus murimartini]
MINTIDCITRFIFVETDIGQADVILIPGADHPPLMERASELYRKELAPFILPSGGAKPHVKMTEWQYLRDIGLSLGIPKSIILKEDQAQHTLENAEFSWQVLRKEKICPKKVILICKAGHSRRALLSYQAVFPKETKFYISSVTDRFDITKDNWYLSDVGIKRVMSEVEKIGKFFGPLISGMY